MQPRQYLRDNGAPDEASCDAPNETTMTPTTLRIATRKSALALWQAEHVAAELRAVHPGLFVDLVPLSTRGDEILDKPLATIGGKGLFLRNWKWPCWKAAPIWPCIR